MEADLRGAGNYLLPDRIADFETTNRDSDIYFIWHITTRE